MNATAVSKGSFLGRYMRKVRKLVWEAAQATEPNLLRLECDHLVLRKTSSEEGLRFCHECAKAARAETYGPTRLSGVEWAAYREAK